MSRVVVIDPSYRDSANGRAIRRPRWSSPKAAGEVVEYSVDLSNFMLPEQQIRMILGLASLAGDINCGCRKLVGSVISIPIGGGRAGEAAKIALVVEFDRPRVLHNFVVELDIVDSEGRFGPDEAGDYCAATRAISAGA